MIGNLTNKNCWERTLSHANSPLFQVGQTRGLTENQLDRLRWTGWLLWSSTYLQDIIGCTGVCPLSSARGIVECSKRIENKTCRGTTNDGYEPIMTAPAPGSQTINRQGPTSFQGRGGLWGIHWLSIKSLVLSIPGLRGRDGFQYSLIGSYSPIA